MVLNTPYDRITIEPEKMSGQPCIRGIRITVHRVLELVATYADRTELFRDYPYLEEQDLKQALEFPAANLEDRIEWFSVA